MNKYAYQFAATCPANGDLIIYFIVIETEKRIFVEHIKTACAMWARGYHEDIADSLFKQLGGRQVISANHHGVEIETIRALVGEQT